MLSIEVEPLIGSSIEEVLEEAKQLSRHLGCRIHFDLNGIEFSIGPELNIPEAVSQFHKSKTGDFIPRP